MIDHTVLPYGDLDRGDLVINNFCYPDVCHLNNGPLNFMMQSLPIKNFINRAEKKIHGEFCRYLGGLKGHLNSYTYKQYVSTFPLISELTEWLYFLDGMYAEAMREKMFYPLFYTANDAIDLLDMLRPSEWGSQILHWPRS